MALDDLPDGQHRIVAIAHLLGDDDPDEVRVGDIAWVLGAHVRAIANLLDDSGDITPYGSRLLRQAVAQHLPGVTWEGDD